MDNDVVMRSLAFDSEIYDSIMQLAKEEDRTFPKQVMWMLKQQMRVLHGVEE